MPRFSRKLSAKDKQAKGKNSESGKSKGKSNKHTTLASNEDTDRRSNLIGIQECRKLLACVSGKKSAKCVATFRRKSQLSKSLVEVLMDDSVLPYFMEYMQKQNATNLLNFWLTAETFRLSTINRLRINSISRLKTSKVDNTCTNLDGRKGVMSNSDIWCISSSSNESNTIGNSQGAASQLQCDSDNEFGDFTGYEPEKSERYNASQNSTNVVLLCDKCGHFIDPPSPNKVVCDHCGQSIGNSHTSNGTSSFDDSCGSSYKQPPTSVSGDLQNGINQNNINNQSNVKDTQAAPQSISSDAGVLKGCRLSKVTFDLKPDFEHEQREFCRRRTRSIVIDAVSIYSKYISLEASHPIGLEESIRRQIEMNICSEDGRICPDSFQPGQRFAFDVMERITFEVLQTITQSYLRSQNEDFSAHMVVSIALALYFPTFVSSSFYCKHQIDILTSGKVFLSDILYNQNAMFYFMEHLEQEGVQHMLEFWLTADNFHCHLKSQLEHSQYNAEHALDDAMIIYNKYFSMQASVPLGVDDITRIEIENSICREGGPLPDCFSCPMEHVLCLLEEVFFPSFLQSEVYFKYLTELLNSVSEQHSAASVGSVDDVRSLGSQMDENSRLVRSTFGSDPDLTEHPDAIWQRPNAGPLSLGKVNEFGIFEPIFEPEPDSGNGISTAAKLGKAMRKLVSGVEDKAKEEMAWKIAKMIIEDVKNEQGSTAGLWTEEDSVA